MCTKWISVLLLFLTLLFLPTSTFSIIPPRPGSEAQFPLTPSEIRTRGIGQPGPVPQRFIVKDQFGKERLKVEDVYLVPVLLGEYSNSTGTYPAEDFQALLFDGPNPTGTMTEYYEEISYGAFSLDGTVYGWYAVAESSSFYESSNNGLGTWPNNAAHFVYDLAAASDAVVDYSIYDNDGPDGLPNSGDDDGYVDQFFAIHTGNGGECGLTSNIWSHKWSISWSGGPVGGYVTDDSSASGGFIHVDEYIIQPEMNCDKETMIGILVFCHEFGHSLGLPDLYDYDYSSEGIGNWGLMGGGGYGWGGPSHMCAWSKEQVGWIEPIEVISNTGIVSLPQVEDSPTVVKLWKDGDYSGDEYFLVENRQKAGFDVNLPIPGILIWHIDNSMPNNDNENHKLVDLEAADGLNDMDLLVNWGDIGDPWPGITGNRTFGWHTNPNSNSYGSSWSEVVVNNIGDPCILMDVRFTISTAEIDSIEWELADPLGDRDGVWDVDEEIELDILVFNGSEEPAESLWAVVSCKDPAVSVMTSSVYLGTLEGNSQIGNTGSPFVLRSWSSPGPGEHRTEICLALYGANDFFWETSFKTVIGHPDLLVVDDSEPGSDIFRYYSTTLDSLAIPFTTRTVHSQGSPADSLYPFDRIIWFTGQESENILDSLDLIGLSEHLAGGGQLLLTGQNIAEDLYNREESFLSDVLKVDWGGTSALPSAYGVSGDPITGSIEKILTAGARGADNQTSRDILLVQSGADPIAVYDTTSMNQAAAVRIENPGDSSRIVFLGFGFEAVNSTGSDYVTRRDFMNQILNWLSGAVGIDDWQDPDNLTGLPMAYAISQNYPNPFNPSTTIAFDIPETIDSKRHISLTIYDIRGRRVRMLIDSELEPGTHKIHWDGRNDRGQSVASGIYLYTLIAEGKTYTRKMTVLK